MTWPDGAPYKGPMFGFSIAKLLFTIVIVAIVWYGFKWVGRVQAGRGAEEGRLRSGKPAARRSREDSAVEGAVDMVKCAVCEEYVPAGQAANCGRPDCPYPG